MLSLGRSAVLLLALLLAAGCASGPQGRRGTGADWQSDDSLTPSIVPPAGFPVVGPTPPAITTPLPQVRQEEQKVEFPETWVPLNRWCKANGLKPLQMVSPQPSPAYALVTTNGTFLVRAGSEAAQWDGTEVRLGFAPQMINGQPFVHTLDLRKTIQPLLSGASHVKIEDPGVIVIDPGHGGENAGTKSVLGDFYEKEYTLDWARRLQSLLLTNSSWKVVLTRSNDLDLALSNRVAFAEAQNAAIFVSLHFNSAAPNSAEGGLETYCLTPTGLPSNLTRGPDDLSLNFPNNAFDGENLQLALQVHRALLEVNNRDRGVRRARFPGVLRGQRCPAILVEGGFLSNPREAQRIADPAYRQKLAEAVAHGLLSSRAHGQDGVSAANP